MAVTLPLPPEEMNFIGGGDFDAIGREFLNYFIKFGGLKPHHRVLDVGCGIGRMARPLAEYLSSTSRYDGFDIVDVGIDWCRRNITPRLPNFRFHLADVYSAGYHPAGAYDAAEYVFPFASESFDFVFLTSVFTHMRPAAVANYLSEIARVLAPNGRCLITYFLQTPETRRLGADRRGRLNFVHQRDGYWVDAPEATDEDAICLDEEYMLGLYEKNGLAVDGPIRRGEWCGRQEFVSFQDIVVAQKVRSVPQRRPQGEAIRAVRRFARRVQRWLRPDPIPVSTALHNVLVARHHAANAPGGRDG
jgi:SAM-dependent methyltransferase